MDSIAIRKHGRKAAVLSSRFRLQRDCDTREAGSPGQRLTTTLTFETDSRAYVWVTDRGRSRLVKH